MLLLLSGDALTELAETTDTNAVLVLQPAVEAFFLVHGAEKDEEEDKNKEDSNKPSGRDPLQSSSSIDIPASPGPYSPGASLSPVGSRHGSQSSSFAHLPADTQKFLRFAGNGLIFMIYVMRIS